MNARISRVWRATKEGTISVAEADAYLRAYCDCTYDDARKLEEERMLQERIEEENRAHQMSTLKISAISGIAILLVLAVVFYMPSGLTGLAVLDVAQQNLSSGEIPITENVLALNISGVLHGDGSASVYFDSADNSRLVAAITSDTGEPRTTKPSYNSSEFVDVEHAPDGASYYFDDGISTAPVTLPLSVSVNGTLLIVVNGTDASTYRLPVIIGEAQRSVAFSQLCLQTCSMQPTNGTLRIETTGNATLELVRVDALTLMPNNAPVQALALQLSISAPAVINLSQYFADPDGDELQYSAGASTIANISVSGSMLTITPLQEGNETISLYVSDMQELVPFAVPLHIGSTAADQNNESQAPLQNISVQVVSPGALDCSDANPNLRPTECLLQNATAYFPDQEIFWENLDRSRVAKFTVIGNLLLTGEVIEHSNSTPGARDFSIGYTDHDDNTMKTIWIDSDGNLHLRGTLVEENINMQPPQGSYSVLTRRSIYIAYADATTGTLHLRGNVIPGRRSIV
jgi:hypothetical protein